jgi:uncharacterized YigZ family protein
MTTQHFIPAETIATELSIKKSVFISTVRHIKTRGQVKIIVQAQRAQHPKANHVVWAFCLNIRNRQDLGMSDDGEPSGTAGRPTLKVLQHSQLTNTLVTTIRYFGGTKLGTGGLVKAYTESAKQALDQVSRIPLIKKLTAQLKFPYEQLKTIKRTLDQPHVQIVDIQYGAAVTLTCLIPEESLAQVEEQLTECTSGRISISVRDSLTENK